LASFAVQEVLLDESALSSRQEVGPASPVFLKQEIAAIPLLYQPGTKWSYSVAVAPRGWRVEVVMERSRYGILLAVLLLTVGCGGSPTIPSPLTTQPTIVYEPGNGVSLPSVLREVTPLYTTEAIAARIQGTVLMSVVVCCPMARLAT
jgi:hypothetical protein